MVIARLTGTSVDLNADRPAIGVPDIAFETHTFPNGLRLVVHEDRTTPRVAMQIRYNVGAKEEPAGYTGFAHLFEHLMFKGSANRPGGWHKSVTPLGATNINGTTSYDRTNFYQTVPTAALDRVLWMEADRMGFVVQGVDAKSLEEEIEVVKNEKRQMLTGPYTLSQQLLWNAMYPKTHPYGHHVIGDEVDLNAATLDTAAYWHKKWYGASNAVIALVGDIDMEQAKAKVERWFGSLPAGEPVQHLVALMPSRGGLQRFVSQERVPYAVHMAAWHTCNSSEPDSVLLGYAGNVLGGGIRSRLHIRLVENERLCLGVSAGQGAQALCGMFQISATAAPGADIERIEAIIHEELARLIAEGPTQDELDHLRRGQQNGYIGALESIEFKAEMLSNNMLVHGTPDGDRYLKEVGYNATPEQIRAAAARWIDRADQSVAMNIVPTSAQDPEGGDVDRSVAPDLGDIHAPKFPEIEHAKLSNGMSVRLARRPAAPRVKYAIMLNGGGNCDPIGKEGLTGLTLTLVSKDKTGRTVFDFDESLNELGIEIFMGASGENATMGMSSLPQDMGKAMLLTRELILEPALTDDEFQKQKDLMASGLRHRMFPPPSLAERVANKLTFDFVREPTVEGVEAFTLDDVVSRYKAWLDPSKAVMFIAGNVTMEEVVAAAEAAFGDWQKRGPALEEIEPVYKSTPGYYAISAPNEAQTTIKMMCLDDRLKDLSREEAVGVFTACLQERLTDRLRGPGWTYGVGVGAHINPKLGFLQIMTSLQANKSMEALSIMEEEIRALSGDRPITQAEFDEVQSARVLGLVNHWTNNDAVLGPLQRQYVLGLPEDFAAGLEARVRGTTLADMKDIASWFSDTSRFVVAAAGDKQWLPVDRFTYVDQDAQPVK